MTLRSRTWVNEVVSLVPDFMYGIAIAWLFMMLATATTLVGLVSTVPAAWLVWKLLHRQGPDIE